MNDFQYIKDRATAWTGPDFDLQTRQEVEKMFNDPQELTECFYKDLEFGTGGLRGIMGVGTNRMNVYTVGLATQGLANYLKRNCSGEIKVAVAYDCRINSQVFANTVAGIFAENGIKVYLFDDLRPTPELSFAIRHFGCQSGVMVTASHNPKEYNGYKAYWADGGQVVPPHDKAIIEEVKKVKIADVRFGTDATKHLIEIVGSQVDEIYTDKILELSLLPKTCPKNDVKIVYTPLHGTGIRLVPMVLRKQGFTNIFAVDEQNIVDGNFPTVKSPNPEESAALALGVAKAKAVDADILMGTDPDADRVGLAVKNHSNEWVLLTGNQAAAVLLHYLITRWRENGKLQGKEYIVKTIVTTDLLAEMAAKNNIVSYDVLTGFKWIAEKILEREKLGEKFIGGGEESYGYLCGEFVRDKDAVMACAFFAEITAWAKQQGKTFYDILLDIYQEYGLFKEKGISLVRKGKSGAEEIAAMMQDLRNNPPALIAGSRVTKILDYASRTSRDLTTNSVDALLLPKSEVLQFITEDATKVTVRPSGTEPKIKFYLSVRTQISSSLQAAEDTLNEKIIDMMAQFGL